MGTFLYIQCHKKDFYNIWITSARQETCLRTCVECKNWPIHCRNWFHQYLLLSLLICEARTWSHKKVIWTVCMRWMDLELCTRDGCKNWPVKGLVPPNKFSSWVCWSVKQRLGPTQNKVQDKKLVLEPELSACPEWIFNFVQEMGVRTDQRRSCFVLSFAKMWSNKKWTTS